MADRKPRPPSRSRFLAIDAARATSKIIQNYNNTRASIAYACENKEQRAVSATFTARDRQKNNSSECPGDCSRLRRRPIRRKPRLSPAILYRVLLFYDGSSHRWVSTTLDRRTRPTRFSLLAKKVALAFAFASLASSRVRAKMTSCAFVSSRVHRRSTAVGEKISVRV